MTKSYKIFIGSFTDINMVQALNQDQKTHILIPLLEKDCFQMEIFNFYDKNKLYTENYYSVKKLLELNINMSFIEKYKIINERHWCIYYCIIWKNIIFSYNQKNSNILSRKETAPLLKICEKHRAKIFSQTNRLNIILERQSVYGFMNLSFLLVSLSLSPNKKLDEIWSIAKKTISNLRAEILDFPSGGRPVTTPRISAKTSDFEEILNASLKDMKFRIEKLNKKELNDLKLLKELFLKLYPTATSSPEYISQTFK